MNDIPERQNTEPLLRLQRAKVQVYDVARRYQLAQIILTVVLPVLGAITAIKYPQTSPPIAGIALLIAVLDALWLDRAQRQLLKTAAKISERFDCELLRLNWNKFTAGKPLDGEIITGYAQANKKGNQGLIDWYPIVVGAAPLWIGKSFVSARTCSMTLPCGDSGRRYC